MGGCDLTCSQLIAMHGNSSSALKGQVYRDTGHSVRIQSWQNLLSLVCAVEMLFLVGFRLSPRPPAFWPWSGMFSRSENVHSRNALFHLQEQGLGRIKNVNKM